MQARTKIQGGHVWFAYFVAGDCSITETMPTPSEQLKPLAVPSFSQAI